MNVELATTKEQREACIPVMRELRTHLDEQELARRIERQSENGYRLAYLRDGDSIVAVAGFRLGEALAWGTFLYVDDLVTSEALRSKGYGQRLLSWLKAYAIEQGCTQIHLDSGLQREDAHRFYRREGMANTGYHFAEGLLPNK